MTQFQTSPLPNHLSVTIGRSSFADASIDKDVVAHIRWLSKIPGTTVYGVVQNTAETPFTLSLFQSSDNGDSDAWATHNMRIDGSNVTTVSVLPSATVEFLLEVGIATEEYLRFTATPAVDAAGIMHLVYAQGYPVVATELI